MHSLLSRFRRMFQPAHGPERLTDLSRRKFLKGVGSTLAVATLPSISTFEKRQPQQRTDLQERKAKNSMPPTLTDRFSVRELFLWMHPMLPLIHPLYHEPIHGLTALILGGKWEFISFNPRYIPWR